MTTPVPQPARHDQHARHAEHVRHDQHVRHAGGRPADLRHRAAGLRSLADRIDSTPALRLGVHAGPDTWRNPRAELCRLVLDANRTQVYRAVDELRRRAHRLELRAEELERAAADLARLGGAT